MPFRISEIVIWPISLVHGSSVFYITSQIVKSDSILHLMINLKHPDTHENMYSSRVYSTICPRCRIHGIQDCKHDIFMPRYFDKQRALMTRLLMQSKNNETYQREIRNEYVEPSIKSCFDPKTINILMRPEHEYVEYPQQNEVFVVIDPAAGGEYSRYAIVSFITPTIIHPEDKYPSKILVVCYHYFFYYNIPTIMEQYSSLRDMISPCKKIDF
jgi:hypothetical protein